jgi:hypothetical protein
MTLTPRIYVLPHLKTVLCYEGTEDVMGVLNVTLSQVQIEFLRGTPGSLFKEK